MDPSHSCLKSDRGGATSLEKMTLDSRSTETSSACRSVGWHSAVRRSRSHLSLFCVCSRCLARANTRETACARGKQRKASIKSALYGTRLTRSAADSTYADFAHGLCRERICALGRLEGAKKLNLSEKARPGMGLWHWHSCSGNNA